MDWLKGFVTRVRKFFAEPGTRYVAYRAAQVFVAFLVARGLIGAAEAEEFARFVDELFEFGLTYALLEMAARNVPRQSEEL